MSASSSGLHQRIGDDHIAYECITSLSFFLSAGLLACTGVFPLIWPAGQQAVLLIALALLPVSAAWSTLRLARLDGMAAANFSRNVRLVHLAILALLCVVLPAMVWRVEGVGYALSSWGFGGPVLVSLALCLLNIGMASSNARAWSLLHVQAWETVEDDRSASGAPRRDELLQQNRLRWITGGIVLALALLGHGARAPEQLAQTWLGVLALVLYIVAGLAFMSLAARTRMTTLWRLGGFTVSPDLSDGWSRLSLSTALAVLLATGCLLAFHVLDLAHAILSWLIDSVLLPLLRLLPLDVLHATAPSSCTSCANTHSPPPLPHHLQPPRSTGGEAGIWTLLGELWQALMRLLQLLVANWPLVLGIVALLALLYSMARSRHVFAGGGLLRSLLAIVLHDLRAFAALLRRPGRQLLDRVQALASDAAARGVKRLRIRRGPDLHNLTPRRAVIALYVAALDLAAKRGHSRAPGQTPAEFAAGLVSHVPPVRDAIEPLTQVFVEVRYGGLNAERAQVHRAQELWRSLRQVLVKRAKRRGGNTG